MYHLKKPSRRALADLAAEQARFDVTYEIGLTASTDPPTGYHRFELRRELGTGGALFDDARAAIADWAGHRRAGATVEPERPELVVGGVVAVALHVGPLWVTAVNRIVEVIDDPDRFGFAYGTLPHHPESGEEIFLVVRDPRTGIVWLEIVAVARAASTLARLGGPAGRIIQRLTAGRYLDGFQDWRPPGRAQRAPRPRAGSLQWWFRNRETGRWTVAQFPNWPLFAIGAGTVVRRLADAGSALDSGAGWVVTGLWFYWATDELVRGVNPWRRLLGAAVIAWQVWSRLP